MLLNEDQIALRDVARRFAREKLKPRYQAREAEPGFDRALMKEIGQGFLKEVTVEELAKYVK